MSEYKLPGNTHRTTFIGRTGSGKSTFAAFVLSQQNFDKKPWVIIDYKYDPLLNSIPRLEEILPTARVPRSPGIYIMHPFPHEEEEVTDFLWRVYNKEKVGIYYDELTNFRPTNPAVNALFTQGRTKQIPILSCTQRPSRVSLYAFTEATYLNIFDLIYEQDRKRVEEYCPVNLSTPLPEYFSRWYDVAKNKSIILRPAPDREIILDMFNDRMPRRWFASRVGREHRRRV